MTEAPGINDDPMALPRRIIAELEAKLREAEAQSHNEFERNTLLEREIRGLRDLLTIDGDKAKGRLLVLEDKSERDWKDWAEQEERLKRQASEAEARAEGFQKCYEDALTGNQAILARESQLRAALEAAQRECGEWRHRRDLEVVRAEEAEEIADELEPRVEDLEAESAKLRAALETIVLKAQIVAEAKHMATLQAALKPQEGAVERGKE
jgi:hypothetical protein